jgi:hypothetical protein
MVPKTIRRRLAGLRRRELLLRLTWGLARAVALLLVLLGLACLTDWVIDRFQETPPQVRAALLGVQVLAAAAAVLFFLVLPLAHRPGNTELALLVESKAPELGDRLISAVQLNRPGAQTQGMSPELIGRVTAEAEARAARLRFTQVSDHRRLGWSAAVATPVLLAAGLALLLWPDVVEALLRRQLLADVDIPRSVYLTNVDPELWYRPTNEEVVLRFRARGPAADQAREGVVLVRPRGQEAEAYPLTRESADEGGGVVFAARIPPSAVDFSYRAWLEDGRTPRAHEVRYAPRPVVNNLEAWVQLPAYVGLRPKSHAPYEQQADRAEVVALAGSAARVRVEVSQPLREAVVDLLGVDGAPRARRVAPNLGRMLGDYGTAAGTFRLVGLELLAETASPPGVALTVDEKGAAASGSFYLWPDEHTYRVVVKNEHGFENVPAPRRGIRLVAEDPPQVTLLGEEFRPGGRLAGLRGPRSDFEMEGLPVPEGGRVRIAYACSGPYGVGHARLRFRLIKKGEESGSESEAPKEGDWHTLPLIPVKGSPEAGPFDAQRGVFRNSGDDDQVWFFPGMQPDPEHSPARTPGGGRFDFSTRGIPDGEGGFLTPRRGDQVEYYVEVFADPDPGARRPSARSEARRKLVVTGQELVRWLNDVRQEEQRLRQLENKQRGVFDGD